MSRYRLILLAAALSLTGGAAFALTAQDIINTLSSLGYTRIELKTGPTQTKVEAIRGTEKLEVIYDNASGDTLKSEVQAVEPGENTAPGVSVRNRNRDFLRGDGNDDANDGGADNNDDDGDNAGDDGDNNDDDGDDDDNHGHNGDNDGHDGDGQGSNDD